MRASTVGVGGASGQPTAPHGAIGQSTSALRRCTRSFTSAKVRFALGGLALATALALGGPALARALSNGGELLSATCAAIFMACIGYALGRQVDQLHRRSLEDPMTRVGNRRYWEQRLREECDRAVKSRMPLSVLVLDVDNLKKMNDAYGHGCGDRALQIVGEVMRATCRSRDVAARFGGDEFAILLPRTRLSEAKVVAERIRSELARRRSALGSPLDELLTLSIGVADFDGAGRRTDTLFQAADSALYAAKSGGRDRVEVTTMGGVIDLQERRSQRPRELEKTSKVQRMRRGG